MINDWLRTKVSKAKVPKHEYLDLGLIIDH